MHVVIFRGCTKAPTVLINPLVHPMICNTPLNTKLTVSPKHSLKNLTQAIYKRIVSYIMKQAVVYLKSEEIDVGLDKYSLEISDLLK